MSENYSIFMKTKTNVNGNTIAIYRIPSSTDIRNHGMFAAMGKKKNCQFHLAENISLTDMPTETLIKDIFEKLEISEDTKNKLIEKFKMTEFVFRLGGKEEREAYQGEIYNLKKQVARLKKQLAENEIKEEEAKEEVREEVREEEVKGEEIKEEKPKKE